MLIGLGNDIVEVARFTHWLHNTALQNRYFTQSELQYIHNVSDSLAISRLAGMFAAKESFIKAVMTPVKLTDLIIEKNKQGAPKFFLEGSALHALHACGGAYTLLSISHEKLYAIATVVIGC